MSISRKAKDTLMRAVTTGREIACVAEETEKELIRLGLMIYSTRPLMKPTYEGKKLASNWQRNRR